MRTNSGHEKAPQEFMDKSTLRTTKKVNYKNELHKRIDKNDCPKHKARPGEIKFSPNARYPSEGKQNKRKQTDNGINLVDRQKQYLATSRNITQCVSSDMKMRKRTSA